MYVTGNAWNWNKCRINRVEPIIPKTYIFLRSRENLHFTLGNPKFIPIPSFTRHVCISVFISQFFDVILLQFNTFDLLTVILSYLLFRFLKFLLDLCLLSLILSPK